MAEKVTKPELIDVIHKVLPGKLTKAESTQVFEALVDKVRDTTLAGGTVAIHAFGTFSLAMRKERDGVNPRDPKGPKLHYPATGKIVFKAVPSLKVVEKPAKAAKKGKK
jgi:nucleoid DNA-binding protein